jgi:cytoskeletal protein RodZ
MSEHELDKLLGGFAADTLTPEERQKLFTAALQDQQLFNALADEQALRDLLADPVVRRRLLQALNQTGASGAGGSLSWLDWLRRPATLAYVGGLAVAVFAVVLGTKVYQESLRQTALTVATEDTKAAAPPSAAPQASQPAESPATVEEPKANVNVGPAAEPTKKGLQQDQRPPHAARDDLRQKAEPDKTRRNVEPPVAALGKSAEKATAPAPEIHANTPTSGTGAPAVGARALF